MSFDTLKLDKGLYTSSKGFTKALEEVDPSENYKGTELEGLDAYERQLKRYNIKVSGPNSDTVSKFFQSSNSATLFPEYVSRAVKLGLNNNILEDIVATTTIVDSLDYRSIACEDTEEATVDSTVINEGSYIPETAIKTKDTLTKLYKHGKSITASYEALKNQRLDVFTIALKQIGTYISNCDMHNAVDLLKSSSKKISFGTADKVSYEDFLTMWKALAPYEMNTVIAEKDKLSQILQISEFKDANAGQNFHGTGKLVTPLGAKLVFPLTNLIPDNIIALDKRYALERVQCGDIVTDFDKLIDRQLEMATVTCISGYNRIMDDASVIMR